MWTAVTVHSDSTQWRYTVTIHSDGTQWRYTVTVHSDGTQPVILFFSHKFMRRQNKSRCSIRAENPIVWVPSVRCFLLWTELNQIPRMLATSRLVMLPFSGQISLFSPHLHLLCSSMDIPHDRHLLQRTHHFLTWKPLYVFLDEATLTEVFPCFFLGCKANARV